MGSEQNHGTSFTPSEPKLCANGCGFFGLAANMDLCSKCYLDLRIKEEQAVSVNAAMEKTLKAVSRNSAMAGSEASAAVVSEKFSDLVLEIVDFDLAIVNSVRRSAVMTAKVSTDSASSSSAGDQTPQSRLPNRCFSCNKKVGLTGFKCKCGSMFCGAHRYPENHECSFDYKVSGRNAIAKANPVIKADKIDRM